MEKEIDNIIAKEIEDYRERLKSIFKKEIQLGFENECVVPSDYFSLLYRVFLNILERVGIYVYKDIELDKLDRAICKAIRQVEEMEKLVEAIKNLLKREV